jgi:hypothetical protein
VDQNPPGFANEDEEATYCLSLLRDGDRQQKIVARERLSQIFERRGLLDEAAQCLESNIREGIRDPRIYQRLAGVYRRQGRHELADEVLLEARRLAERLQRGPQPGGRRGAPGRPGRSGPSPAPGVQDTTRQLPNAGAAEQAPAAAPPPLQRGTSGGEFALDQPGDFGGPPRPGVPGVGPGSVAVPAGAPPDRPWWLSPAMVVLLILLCGPYGLAMMWVKGNYPARARKTAVAVWAGLMVLILAAVAVTIQAQVRTAVSSGPLPGVSGLPGVPAGSVPPTAITFPPAPGAQPGAARPSIQPGAAPSPPTVPGAGTLGAPTGVTISPPGAAPSPGAAPAPSPPAAAAKPSTGPEPAAKPASGERVKVVNTGGTGANMRERPGSTAPVVKTVEEGATLQVIGADQQMDGRGWRNVRDEGGATGWIVAEFLEVVP